MALINFNAANVETQDNFDPIPNNWYNVQMVESEMKPTQAGDGHYLECQLKVIDGDFSGRLLWLRLNLDNKNEVAVEIAYKQLATICKAVGLVQVGDSTELHGKPFQVKVVVRPPKGEYDASNEIKGFKAVEGGGGGAASSGSVGGGKPAWAQKKEPVVEKEKVIEKEGVKEKVVEKADAEEKPAWMQGNTEETAAADTTIEKEPVVEKEEVATETADASAKPPWMQ